MQPVSSDAPAYPGESSAKIPKTPCGTVKRAFRAAFPHTLPILAGFHITVSMLLIFGLCDETFSITCSADVPPEVDRGWFYLWVTVLDWCYWVAGAAVGGLLGGLFPFDIKGLDFVMTAMFVVIFVDNLLKEKQHWSSLIGIAGGTIVYMLLVQMM